MKMYFLSENGGLSQCHVSFLRGVTQQENKQTNKNDEVTFTLPHVRIKGGLRYFFTGSWLNQPI